jgi:hypothetical protein
MLFYFLNEESEIIKNAAFEKSPFSLERSTRDNLSPSGILVPNNTID